MDSVAFWRAYGRFSQWKRLQSYCVTPKLCCHVHNNCWLYSDRSWSHVDRRAGRSEICRCSCLSTKMPATPLMYSPGNTSCIINLCNCSRHSHSHGLCRPFGHLDDLAIFFHFCRLASQTCCTPNPRPLCNECEPSSYWPSSSSCTFHQSMHQMMTLCKRTWHPGGIANRLKFPLMCNLQKRLTVSNVMCL